MEPISGIGNAMLGRISIAPVTPSEAFFGSAQAIMPGIRLLAGAGPQMCIPLNLLVGQALECLLKAFLSKHGTPELDLKKFGHNLKELWNMANQRGLPNATTIPKWVEDLSCLYDKPFHLRYPMKLNAIVHPGAVPMASELEQLLEAVKQGIR